MTPAGAFAVAFGLAAALVHAAPADAAPDCSAEQSAGSYCADGSCRSFEVDQTGVRCVDTTLEPLWPPPPDVRFGLGLGAA
jgi:hypothetical protein